MAGTTGTDADLVWAVDRSRGRHSMVIRRRAVSPQARLAALMQTQSTLAHDLDARAVAALNEAREIPPGDERVEAMHEATALRNAVEMHELLCGKRDGPERIG
jgi:hypothetical protein